MSGLEGVLIGLGGKAVGRLVGQKFGTDMGGLAQEAINVLASAFDTEPDPLAIEKRISEVQAEDRPKAMNTVAYAEYQLAPQLLAQAELAKAEAEQMRVANDQQKMTNELLQEQMKGADWKSAWLYVWQWFLMFAWLWSIVLVHIGNALLRVLGQPEAAALPAPDLGVLVTLTGLYMGLHMGGHTALEFVRGGVFGKGRDAG